MPSPNSICFWPLIDLAVCIKLLTLVSLFYKAQRQGPSSLSLMIVAWLWTLHCAMRGLLILAVLCQGLVASSPEVCKLYEDQAAAEQAVFLINKLHHHGYKFKLDSFTKEEVSLIEDSAPKRFFKPPYVLVFVHHKSLHTFKWPMTLCRLLQVCLHV